jgi:hypothetical protein
MLLACLESRSTQDLSLSLSLSLEFLVWMKWLSAENDLVARLGRPKASKQEGVAR